VDFTFSEAQEQFRAEVRAFCATATPRLDDPTRSRGLKGGYSSTFYRELARRGWLGLQIPVEYGGAGLGPIEELILGEELGRSGAPSGNYAGTVLEFGNLILRHGSARQRRTYLPRVADGSIRAGHLYTEPEAGSDLAAIRTTAVRVGDAYLVNGLKTFASEIDRTDYSVLMARTRPDAEGERSISLFILDNRAQGVSYTLLGTTGGKGTKQAYLDRVRIPIRDRIGRENEGWPAFLDIRLEYWTKNQGYYCGTLQRLLDGLVAFMATDRQAPSDSVAIARQRLARLAIDIESLRLLSYRLASSPRPHRETRQIAVLKVFTDELLLRFTDEAMRIVGRDSLRAGEDPAGWSGGSLENRYREDILKHFSSLGHSFARSVLAIEGLGLPGDPSPGSTVAARPPAMTAET
jgi:3-oxocholest-4-en-26-oyl-CoA dehydrogenase alpha subunit